MSYFKSRFESDLLYVFGGEDRTLTIYLAPEAWQDSPVRTRLGEVESQFLFLTALFLLSLEQSMSDSSIEVPIPKVFGILSGCNMNYAPNVYLSAAALWLQSDKKLLKKFHENPSFFEQEGFHINADVYNRLQGMININSGLFGNFTSTEINYDVVSLILKKISCTYIQARE